MPLARREPSCWSFLAVAACLWLALPAARAAAQQQPQPAPVFDATNLTEPKELGGIWLIHAGDDPAYARPDFDDSQWMPFDAYQDLRTYIPREKPPVVWYRLRVKLGPAQTHLALEEYSLSSAFQIFANGALALQNGSVAPFAPYTFIAHVVAPLPAKADSSGTVVLALRVHISPSEWGSTNPGFFPSNLVLGDEHELRDNIWLSALGGNSFAWANSLFGFGLGLVALALFVAQRSQREYLWMFLYFLGELLTRPLLAIELFRNVPATLALVNQPLYFAAELFLVLMYLAFLRLPFALWLRIYFGAAGAAFLIVVSGTTLGLFPPGILALGVLPMAILASGILPFLLIVHFRRGNREAGILLVPLLLVSATIYLQIAGAFASALLPGHSTMIVRMGTFLFNHPVGPFTLGINDFALLFFNLSLTIIVVLRATRTSRQQALLEGEVAAAREVQQVIVPEQVESVPGFAIDTMYLPAQQVGGDFFQVLPAGDGGLLVVVGDVAGKGLPAAMLVSVLIGAIRTAAEYTKDPAELLAQLNERLVGRASGGFSTALAARISAEGEVSIANAGHLSPYVDGREIALEGALPLGIVSGATYDTTRFDLPAGSRLTFYSDGVVEAQKPSGELLGFDRAQALSTQTASAIVEAARQFGQQDDITVVTIDRAPALAFAAA